MDADHLGVAGCGAMAAARNPKSDGQGTCSPCASRPELESVRKGRNERPSGTGPGREEQPCRGY